MSIFKNWKKEAAYQEQMRKKSVGRNIELLNEIGELKTHLEIMNKRLVDAVCLENCLRTKVEECLNANTRTRNRGTLSRDHKVEVAELVLAWYNGGIDAVCEIY